MVMEIFSSLGVFKTMLDTAKALKDMNDTAIRNGAVIDLQEQILSAQEEQSTLIHKVSELEEEVTHLKAWDAEREKYQLADIGSGIMAYVLKEETNVSEPSHKLCAYCFDDRKKSFLQPEVRSPGRAFVLVCHRCGSDLYIDGSRHPEHRGFQRRPVERKS